MTNVDVIVVKAKEALMSLKRNDRVHIFKPIYFSAFRQRITNTDILKEAINSFDTVLMKQYLSFVCQEILKLMIHKFITKHFTCVMLVFKSILSRF